LIQVAFIVCTWKTAITRSAIGGLIAFRLGRRCRLHYPAFVLQVEYLGEEIGNEKVGLDKIGIPETTF